MLSHGGDDAHRGHHRGSVSAGRDRGGACRGAGSSKAHARTCSERDHRGQGCDKVQGDTVMKVSEGEQSCSKVHWNRTARVYGDTVMVNCTRDMAVMMSVGTRAWQDVCERHS